MLSRYFILQEKLDYYNRTNDYSVLVLVFLFIFSTHHSIPILAALFRYTYIQDSLFLSVQLNASW